MSNNLGVIKSLNPIHAAKNLQNCLFILARWPHLLPNTINHQTKLALKASLILKIQKYLLAFSLLIFVLFCDQRRSRLNSYGKSHEEWPYLTSPCATDAHGKGRGTTGTPSCVKSKHRNQKKYKLQIIFFIRGVHKLRALHLLSGCFTRALLPHFNYRHRLLQ